MGLDPPTGCAFTTIKSSSLEKLETFQIRFSNVKAIVASERKALKRERITPVMTVNGTVLPQSMAYAIVGARRCLKEVPKIVKIGFRAWRSSSSSYEVVQGSPLFNFLLLFGYFFGRISLNSISFSKHMYIYIYIYY